MNSMRCETEASGLGHYKNYWPVACLICRLVLSSSKQSKFGVYVPGPVPLSLLEASLEHAFRDADPTPPATQFESLRCRWIFLRLTRFSSLGTMRIRKEVSVLFGMIVAHRNCVVFAVIIRRTGY